MLSTRSAWLCLAASLSMAVSCKSGPEPAAAAPPQQSVSAPAKACESVQKLELSKGPKDQQCNPVAILQAGSGVVELVVHNDDEKNPVTLALSPGVVVDETSRIAAGTAKVAFPVEGQQAKTGGPQTAAEASQKPAAAGAAANGSSISLAAGHTVRVQAQISGVSGVSSARIPVFNGTAPFTEIEAVAADAPLNVVIDGNGSSGTPLVFHETENEGSNPTNRTTLTLKNNDLQTYPLKWTFTYRGMTATGTVTLLPKASLPIDLVPSGDIYLATDRIHPSTQTGHMRLELNLPVNAGSQILPTRDLDVNLSIHPWSPTWTAIIANLYVAVVLFFGALISLLANAWIPNTLRKSALHSQLKDLANRTSSISDRVDSYLRVLLRLERKKIEVALSETGPLVLGIAARLDDVSTGMDQLSKRVTAAERLDSLRRKLENSYATTPPSVVQAVNAKLQSAADQLGNFALSDDNVAAANKSLDGAQATLDGVSDAVALAKQTAENFSNLKKRVQSFNSPYADLQAALPGIFSILSQPFDDAQYITAPMIYGIDHRIAAINLALDCAVVRASAATGRPAINPDKVQELEDLLQNVAWQPLREAQMLVQEMREGVYESDVLEEVGKDGQTSLCFDSQKTRPYLPVNFCIEFKDPRFSGAAAMNRLWFQWKFPNGLNEKGPKVCHYFQGDEPAANGKPLEKHGWRRTTKAHDVRIEVTVQSQRAALTLPAKTLTRDIEVQGRSRSTDRSRAFAEALQFFIAFGAALAGMLAGGESQLEKLDILPATFAIFALGFGADTIKNLLTQSAKKSS